MSPVNQIRCQCPSCKGLLWLESSGKVALCPHCGRAVKADGDIPRQAVLQGVARALAQKAAYWEAELAQWAAEFGAAAVAGLAEDVRAMTDRAKRG